MELIERIFPLFMRFYLNCETNWCVEFNKKWIPFVNSLSFAEYIELNNLITFSSFQKRKQAANKKERISLFVFTFFCYQLLINLKGSNTKIGKKMIGDLLWVVGYCLCIASSSAHFTDFFLHSFFLDPMLTYK